MKQHRLALTAQRRALAARIVPHPGKHTPVLAYAGVVGMLQRIAAAVHPRRLAVPHAGHAIELLPADRVQHLRTPHGSRREVFIEAVDEMYVMLEQELLPPDQRRIEHTER